MASLNLPPSEPMRIQRRWGWVLKYQDLTPLGLRRHREYLVLWCSDDVDADAGTASGEISFFRQARRYLSLDEVSLLHFFVLCCSLASVLQRTLIFCRDSPFWFLPSVSLRSRHLYLESQGHWFFDAGANHQLMLADFSCRPQGCRRWMLRFGFNAQLQAAWLRRRV